jgi:hypothetical protein
MTAIRVDSIDRASEGLSLDLGHEVRCHQARFFRKNVPRTVLRER